MENAPFYSDIARAPLGEICEYRTASDGVRLRVVGWKGGTKGTVLIFHGRTEYCEKYGPTVEHFCTRGYSVAMVDWRGQGLSQRIHKRPTIGHVENFTDYQLDVAVLLEFLMDHGFPAPRVMLAHSMGGAIGLRALFEGLNIERVLFSAPMWDIAVNGWLNQIIKVYIQSFGRIISPKSLVSSTNIRNPSFVQDLDTNNLTNNAEEYEFRIKQLSTHPDLEIGGPSIQWVYEALRETKLLRAKPTPKVPVMCFLGTDERIVSQAAVYKMMDRMENGTLRVYPDAKHELLIEQPHVTSAIWNEIDQFIA
ncbi:hydrolase [Amylibacter marinus]|uniref:Hydrolase n=1 Tax=Amylibacter marinus TaxID=1475483 RepID=A0ABQ5VTQ0_9RHOB|nr:alpha/beta hydrolase [Amylibacter marinus]GLQ34534.1 hydrolase [Amylibacter marinus]